MKSDTLVHPGKAFDAPSRPVDRRPRVDRALDLLERSRLSASELRILLATRDGEVSLSALARALGARPRHLRRTAARLYARELLRWRHDAETKEAVFGITPAGRAMVRPLVTVGGG